MAGGMDMMISALLKATGFNVDDVRKEVTTRYAEFERNVAQHKADMDSMHANLRAICAKLEIPYTPPVTADPYPEQDAFGASMLAMTK